MIQQIDEDTTFEMTQEDAISKLIEKMEGKFEVSKWKKAGVIWEEMIKFQIVLPQGIIQSNFNSVCPNINRGTETVVC